MLPNLTHLQTDHSKYWSIRLKTWPLIETSSRFFPTPTWGPHHFDCHHLSKLKIKPKPFFDRLGESLTKSLDTEIRDDNVQSFDWLKECVVFNTRKHKRDSNFQSTPASQSSKQTKGFNKKGHKGLKIRDAAHAFQAGMYESMDCLLLKYVLIWIDDLLVYSKSFEVHLQNLGKFFEKMRKFNIKLNPKMSELFALHIIWCGRWISKDGVSLDSAYLKGLTELPRPATAKQLHHLLWALGWIRSIIPEYARNWTPVQELLKRCQGQANSPKACKISKIFRVDEDI